MTYVPPEYANLKLGDPYPGRPGYVVGGSLRYGITAEPAPLPSITADAPGGSNNPVSYEDARRLYPERGIEQPGVNILGIQTKVYADNHDSRENPTTTEDLAFDIAHSSSLSPQSQAALETYKKENPDATKKADAYNAARAPVEVPVSNPHVLSLADGVTYQTTNEFGQPITLTGGPADTTSLQGTQTAIANSNDRLRELGLQAQPAVQTQATPTTASQKALADDLVRRGYNPVASAAGGGVLALAPTGYKGAEKYAGNSLTDFQNYINSPEYALRVQGLTPVASAVGGGLIGYRQVTTTPTSGTPAQPEDPFPNTTAFLHASQQFATDSVSGGYEKGSALDVAARAGAQFAVGIPAGILATFPFAYDLFNIEPGSEGSRKLQGYLAEGKTYPEAYFRASIDTKGTQAATTGALIALSVVPELRLGSIAVSPVLAVAGGLAVKNALDQPADKFIDTLAFNAGGLVGFKALSDLSLAKAKTNVPVKSEVAVVQVGKTVPTEFLTVETLQRGGFVTAEAEATGLFGIKSRVTSQTEFRAGSLADGGRTAVETSGTATPKSLLGGKTQPIASTTRLEPTEVPFAKVSFSTPESNANPIFLEQPTVSLSRGGGTYPLASEGFPTAQLPTPRYSVSAGDVLFEPGAGFQKSLPVMGATKKWFVAEPSRFSANYQLASLPESAGALPPSARPGFAFSTTTASVTPEGASFLRGTTRVRTDLTKPATINYEFPDSYTLKVNGNRALTPEEFFATDSTRGSFSINPPVLNAPKPTVPFSTPTTKFQSPLSGIDEGAFYEPGFIPSARRITATGDRTTFFDQSFTTSFSNRAPTQPKPMTVGLLSPSKVSLTGEVTPFVGVEKGVTTSGTSFTVKTTGRYYAPESELPPLVGSVPESLPLGDVRFESFADIGKRSTVHFQNAGSGQLAETLKQLTTARNERALPPDFAQVVSAQGSATASLAAQSSSNVAATIARAFAGGFTAPVLSLEAVAHPPILVGARGTRADTRTLLQTIQANAAATSTIQLPLLNQMTVPSTSTRSVLETRAILQPQPLPPILDEDTRTITESRTDVQTQTRTITQPFPNIPEPGLSGIPFPLPPSPIPIPNGGGGGLPPFLGASSDFPEMPAFKGRRSFQWSPSLIAIEQNIRIVVPRGSKSVRLFETGGVGVRPIIEYEGAAKKPKPYALKSLASVGPRKLGPSIGDQIKTYVVKFGGKKK